MTASEPDGVKITIPWDSRNTAENNHVRAAMALIVKMGWNTNKNYNGFVTGTLKDSCVHVFR